MNKLAIITGANLDISSLKSRLGQGLREEASNRYGINEGNTELFAMSGVLRDSRELRRFVGKKDIDKTGVITHSAGLFALMEARNDGVFQPELVKGLAPPLETPAHELMGKRTLRKLVGTFADEWHQNGFEGVKLAAWHTGACAVELCFRHPWVNLGAVGGISRFDAIIAGKHLQDDGSGVELGFYEGDEYFVPTELDLLRARLAKVAIVPNLDGYHDLLTIHPEKALDEFEEAHDALRLAA